MIEVIIPDSEKHWLELRSKDLTSTEVAALFGLNPYLTVFELYHNKKDERIVEFESNTRMLIGQKLEGAIATIAAEENGWKIRKMPEYIRDTENRIGASYDYLIESNPLGVLEAKNVDALVFKDNWVVNDDGSIEAPPQIEIQHQTQLFLSGKGMGVTWGNIAALIGGNRIHNIKRESDEVIQKEIIIRVKAFWESVRKGIEPKPNFARDAATIARLYGYAEKEKFYDASADEELFGYATEHKQVSDEIKKLEEKKNELKARIIMKIGDCEKAVLMDRTTISAGMISECPINYIRPGYRNFRINWKKKKETT